MNGGINNRAKKTCLTLNPSVVVIYYYIASEDETLFKYA